MCAGHLCRIAWHAAVPAQFLAWRVPLVLLLLLLQAFCVDDGSGNMFWDIVTDCAPPGQLNCEGLPDPNPADTTVEPWPEDDPTCTFGFAGDQCFAGCAAAAAGAGATATCNGETGVWDIEVDCA
jgi:hypothetical protein